MADKHEHHEDERTLKHDPNLNGTPEEEVVPKGQKWPEEGFTNQQPSAATAQKPKVTLSNRPPRGEVEDGPGSDAKAIRNPREDAKANSSKPQKVTTPDEKLSHVTEVDDADGKDETDGFTGA